MIVGILGKKHRLQQWQQASKESVRKSRVQLVAVELIWEFFLPPLSSTEQDLPDLEESLYITGASSWPAISTQAEPSTSRTGAPSHKPASPSSG